MTDTTVSSSETDVPKNVEETWDTAKTGVENEICEVKACARSNPLLVVLGALVVGIVLGCLVPHRTKPTRRQRYIDEPLEDFQALARTLSGRAARQAGRGSDAAKGALESIISRIKNSRKF